VYGRWEKRGRVAGLPRWLEAGEKGENNSTLHNILQEKVQNGGSKQIQVLGTGIKGYGKQEV